RVPVHAGQALAEPAIHYGDDELSLRAERTVAIGLRAGQRLEIAVKAPAEVEGPIRRGARLGSARVYVDGRRAAVVGLRAGRAVPEASTLDVLRSFATANVGWLALALSGILVAA